LKAGGPLRFVFVVLDGVGAGALPDAAAYGDQDANTLAHVAELVPLRLPHLARLGLGNILPLHGVPPAAEPLALPGRLAERSAGKDTTNGHWEHLGLVTEKPFPTYPDGFPPELIEAFVALTGRPVLGNRPASGTEIIAELGEKHLRTGRPIVYTSADSVFQIACHLDVCPLEELYHLCRAARQLLTGRHAVARVIARPFTGPPGAFVRTKERKDFSLEPPGPTYLDLLTEAGVPVVGLGKISQIFAGRGVTEEVKVGSNTENLATLMRVLDERDQGLLFTNLVDFDMVWGHRNDVEGFAAGLAEVDAALPALLARLGPRDRLLLTADHGVDPTTVSTDHSREYVPLLYYPRPPAAARGCYEGYMADTGATAYAYLTGEPPRLGGSSLERPAPARGWTPFPGPSAQRQRAQAEEAAGYLRDCLGAAPAAAVVLGSGLQLSGLQVERDLGYDEVPHWPTGRVPGHPGRLLIGRLGSRRLAVLCGRLHRYETGDAEEVGVTVSSLAAWGVEALILTNAAGALRSQMAVDSVVDVARILDLQDPPLGERLPEVPLAGKGAATYAALTGPHYETAAEVAALSRLGADLVGMSAAAEARTALAAGLKVALLSVVSNVAGLPEQGDPHTQVLASSARAAPALSTRVAEVLEELLP